MKDNEYRQAVRRAIVLSMPVDLLQLIVETCRVLEASGQKPEAVFRRIIDEAKHPHDPGSILQQLADLGVIPPTAGTGNSESGHTHDRL